MAYDLNREIADVFCPPVAISAEIIILMLVKFVTYYPPRLLVLNKTILYIIETKLVFLSYRYIM